MLCPMIAVWDLQGLANSVAVNNKWLTAIVKSKVIDDDTIQAGLPSSGFHLHNWRIHENLSVLCAIKNLR